MQVEGTFVSVGLLTLMLIIGGALVPRIADAAFREADFKCAATGCRPGNPNPKAPLCAMFKFVDTTNGIPTPCTCLDSIPGTCVATGFQGIGGGMTGIGGLDQLLGQVFGKLLDQLLKGKQGGSDSGAGAGYTPAQQYPPCVRNTATNTVSPIPCTEVNGQINYGGTTAGIDTTVNTVEGNAADILLNSLNGTNDTPISTVITPTNTSTNTNVNTNTSSNTISTGGKTVSPGTSVLVQQQGALSAQNSSGQGTLQGDIIVSGAGGMLFARSRDPKTNTEVAGFYGGNTFGQQQSSGLIGRMCANRPWSQGVLGGFITPTFFDDLCRRFGYIVGVVAPSTSGTGAPRPSIIITQTPTPRVATTSAPSSAQPEVDIWANPAHVRLGVRTYIFWNTRDVESCVESGPNFSHNTLTGGASTVPLTDASTFTIECKTSDGKTITDSTRVNLAL